MKVLWVEVEEGHQMTFEEAQMEEICVLDGAQNAD